MAALACVNQRRNDGIEHYQSPEGLSQIPNPIARCKELGKRKNKNRKMQQEGGVSKVGDQLAQELSALAIEFGQSLEAGLEAPAVLARVNEREVKFGQPLAHLLKGFGKVTAGMEVFEGLRYGQPVGGRGRVRLYLLKRPDNGESGGGELTELMVEISSPRELSRRECQGH